MPGESLLAGKAAPPAKPSHSSSCCPEPTHRQTQPETRPKPSAWTLTELPDSVLREELLAASPSVRERALEQLNTFGMSAEDMDSLHVGPNGSLFFACRAPAQADIAQPVFLYEAVAQGDALIAEAGVPVSSPPIYHSKPDAQSAIYLDFNGASITGTAWNSNGNTLNAYVWSKDSDLETFSDEEQTIIRRIWQRISEDYAPFNVNVTTDPAYDPETTGGDSNVGWVLFTRDEDTGGADMPAKGAGGVAYVGVFGIFSYASTYSPAFVYADNLGPNNEHFMAEAGSHEMGHNMGLSHDGGTGTTYYSGHASGDLRWGPIMGASYNNDITTWSKGEYTDANQTQDDFLIISNRVGIHPDEAGSSPASATALVFSGNDLVDPLTRSFISDDPNEGIIASDADVDVYSFSTSGGTVSFSVETFVAEDTRLSLGANLDVKLTLLDAAGNGILTSDPQTTVSASLSTTLAAGTYAIAVEGTGYGDPFATPPTGYTDYGSTGMYFITGSAPQPELAPTVLSHSPDPTEGTDTPVNSVTLNFSEPMDPASFDPTADILGFSGPSGIDLSSQLTATSWDLDNTSLTIDFNEQTTEGYYRLVLSSQLTDLVGNLIDQDNDAVQGEAIEDSYSATFLITTETVSQNHVLFFTDAQTDPGFTMDPIWQMGNPAEGGLGGPDTGVGDNSVLATNLAGAYPANLSPTQWVLLPAIDTSSAHTIELSFRRWLGIALKATGGPSGRHADYARIQFSTDGGSAWTDLWASSSAISDSSWITQTITLPASADGQSALLIRFGIESDDLTESFGWNIDNIEVSGILGTALPPAPVVVSHTPVDTVVDPQDCLYIQFSQPMDPGTFSASELASLTGPAGPISISSSVWVDPSVLRIDFLEQSAEGAYAMVINPTIQDVYGSSLNQDLDGSPGEADEDMYTASFEINTFTAAETWRVQYFDSSEDSGDGADDNDFDKDGVVNVVERAFATDPTKPGSVYRPQQSVVEAGSLNYLALEYVRPAGGTGTTGVDYTCDGMIFTVEYTENLSAPWQSGAVTVESVSPPENGMETVVVRLNTDLATQGRQFIRLAVSATE